MLDIKIAGGELWDERTETFIPVNSATLHLEHSLISLSKWESTWKKPFLKEIASISNFKSPQWLDYIRCMTVSPSVPLASYLSLTQKQMETIFKYVNDPMTATWFSDTNKKKKNREIITAEVIYSQMVMLGIPFECEKWHLNRLMALIRVCNEKNGPKQKMGQREAAAYNASLNAARRKAMHTRG